MEETTTTDSTVNDTGVSDETQPVDDTQELAEQPANAVTTQDAPEGDEPSAEASQDDNSTTEWLKKKGVDPSSPEAIGKVAEMARNAEKAMHSKAQKASELEKAIDRGITEEAEANGLTDDDRLDIARIRTKLSVRDFFDNNPDAKPFEQAMIAELSNKPHLAGDLESLYANAVVKSGNIDAVKSQGKKEALQSLAQKQQAAVPRGSAVNSASNSTAITPENVDQLVGSHDHNWYLAHRDEINKAMAG
jgi:hypothetical protein